MHNSCEEKVNQLSKLHSLEVRENLYVTSAKDGLPGGTGTAVTLSTAPINPRMGIVVRYDDKKEFMLQRFREE